MKENAKSLVRASAFSVVVVLFISILNSFFQPVWLDWNNFYTTKGFYEEKQNTIETVFLGPSTILSCVNPMLLYEKFGICAYNLSTEQQPMGASYYWLEETYRLHSETLKTVFLGVSELRNEPSEKAFHKAVDNMKPTKAKYNALLEYNEGNVKDALSNMIPLVSYHNRWENDLSREDFEKHNYNPVNGSRGYSFSSRVCGWLSDPALKMMKLALDEKAEPTKLVESSVEYLDRMVKFCNEKGLKLVLLKAPANNWNSSHHNAVKKLADSYKLEFYDFNFSPYYDEISFVDLFDTSDGCIHMNYYGASKFTNWIGKYLVNKCGATDVRNDSKYDFLKDQQKEFNKRYYRQIELQAIEDISDYLLNVISENTTVMIMVKASAEEKLTEKQRDDFAKFGLEKLSNLRFRDSYLAVIENGKVTYEELKANKTAESKTPLVYGGMLPGGIKYEIKSGGTDHGNVASCKINGKEVCFNKRGINFVVYDNEHKNVLDVTWFDTFNESKRDVYKTEYTEMVRNEEIASQVKDNKLFQKVLERYNLLEETKKAEAERISAKNKQK